MDFIERLCDKVMLLDHGIVLFEGEVSEGINRYRSLLNTEKFFVGLPQRKTQGLVENTKKWADNISDWGKKFGGKEIVIDLVEFIDQRGVKTNRINTREALRVKVSFTVRDRVENPHFGIAIFRKDGVYCYGPNTEFDGHVIPELKPGKGYFMLDYFGLQLAPGEYRVSIAIWDKNESLAFDYHYGYYELTVTGYDNKSAGFLNMPFEVGWAGLANRIFSLFTRKNNKTGINPDLLQDKFGQTLNDHNIMVEYVKFFDHLGNKKDIFMTNEAVKFIISLAHKQPINKGLYLWLGIYRDDGVYCQGVTIALRDCKEYSIIFPKFSLLPGLYSISLGVWEPLASRFLLYQHGTYPLRMVFDKQDHGTIYLDHEWKWGSS
jgi:hypothetical protein